MRFVNCGCGEKYIGSKEWINIDFTRKENVIGHNLLKGLPLEGDSVDVVFSSCMLEHFSLEQARKFLAECYRVLVTDGICRIVVPDLENICREYLNILEKVRVDRLNYDKQYEYILIELIDQMTRTCSGGEMLKYWNSDERDEDYILKRTGYPEKGEQRKLSIIKQLINYRERILYCLFSKKKWFQARNLGRFMLSGEVHKWMYDSYGLQRLMEETGFRNIKVMLYNQSDIVEWEKWQLEVNHDGLEYKPNCLYMEGTK